MPTRDEIESRLTPAAKLALEELVDDYRGQLLLGAADSASRLGDLREVAVQDIMAGLNRQQSHLFGPIRSFKESILRAYFIIGIFLAVGGLLAYAGRAILSGRKLDEQLPLIMALVGVSLSALSYALLAARKIRRVALLRRSTGESAPADPGALLLLWRDIELALRAAAAVRFGESAAAEPIFRLLEHVGTLLSDEERQRLRRVLSLRNSIAHGRSEEMGEEQLATAQREAEQLLGRLRSLAQPK
jgi:hypothetical protein